MPAPYRSRTISDPGDTGTIDTSRSGVCALISGGSGETRTLADPSFLGQEMTICLDTDGGGDVVWTASTAINQTGDNTFTFTDAGEEITVRCISIAGALVWRVASNDGVVVTTP